MINQIFRAEFIFNSTKGQVDGDDSKVSVVLLSSREQHVKYPNKEPVQLLVTVYNAIADEGSILINKGLNITNEHLCSIIRKLDIYRDLYQMNSYASATIFCDQENKIDISAQSKPNGEERLEIYDGNGMLFSPFNDINITIDKSYLY